MLPIALSDRYGPRRGSDGASPPLLTRGTETKIRLPVFFVRIRVFRGSLIFLASWSCHGGSELGRSERFDDLDDAVRLLVVREEAVDAVRVQGRERRLV